LRRKISIPNSGKGDNRKIGGIHPRPPLNVMIAKCTYNKYQSRNTKKLSIFFVFEETDYDFNKIHGKIDLVKNAVLHSKSLLKNGK